MNIMEALYPGEAVMQHKMPSEHFYFALQNLQIKKRTSNELAVYTTEMVAILSLQWIEANGRRSTVVASGSVAALTSIKSGKSASKIVLFINWILKELQLFLSGSQHISGWKEMRMQICWQSRLSALRL